MRQTAFLLGFGVILLVGCESTRWGWLKNDTNKSRIPTPEGNMPSVASLVDYLNDNAGRVQRLKVQDLDITCSVGEGLKTQTFGLAGQMVAEKPRNFRMGAKIVGNPAIDLGSNDQEFWYWLSKAEPPYQVFCNYKDLSEGRVRQMPMPFQPEWVMETMGLGPYGPADKYKLESDAKTIRLVEKSTSPQGIEVRKVIVFQRQPVQAPNPQVTEFLLIDDKTGKEICGAKITEVQVDRGTKSNPGTGAVLPRRIELRYPAEKLRLAMKLDGATINPQLPGTVFARQNMPGVQSFNLALMRVDNSPPPQSFSGDSKLKTAQGFGQ